MLGGGLYKGASPELDIRRQELHASELSLETVVAADKRARAWLPERYGGGSASDRMALCAYCMLV